MKKKLSISRDFLFLELHSTGVQRRFQMNDNVGLCLTCYLYCRPDIFWTLSDPNCSFNLIVCDLIIINGALSSVMRGHSLLFTWQQKTGHDSSLLSANQ